MGNEKREEQFITEGMVLKILNILDKEEIMKEKKRKQIKFTENEKTDDSTKTDLEMALERIEEAERKGSLKIHGGINRGTEPFNEIER